MAGWLAGRPAVWRKRVDAIAMDGFSGFKTAAAKEVPHASAVMDPFHVVQLAGRALDESRRRVQRMIAAYRHPDPARRGALMKKLIEDISAGVLAPLTEIRKLGRTLKKRAVDVVAYFDRPRTSNGPTETINGRFEHLRGAALGFRNLRTYVARSLLEAGGFRPQLHPQLR